MYNEFDKLIPGSATDCPVCGNTEVKYVVRNDKIVDVKCNNKYCELYKG